MDVLFGILVLILQIIATSSQLESAPRSPQQRRSRTVNKRAVVQQAYYSPQQREGDPRQQRARQQARQQAALRQHELGRQAIAYNQARVSWAQKSGSAAWTPCSKSCGGGIVQARFACYSHDLGTYVKRTHCSHIKKPDVKQPCASHPCPRVTVTRGHWFVSQYGACTVSCGIGIQSRLVACLTENRTRIIRDEYCAGKRPESYKVCKLDPCPMQAEWKIGPWSECTKSCGQASKFRSVQCAIGTNTVSPSECHQTRPRHVTSCELAPCVKWVTGPWGKCKFNPDRHACTHAKRKRCVMCVNTDTIESSPNCREDWKPVTWTSCAQDACANKNDVPFRNNRMGTNNMLD